MEAGLIEISLNMLESLCYVAFIDADTFMCDDGNFNDINHYNSTIKSFSVDDMKIIGKVISNIRLIKEIN